MAAILTAFLSLTIFSVATPPPPEQQGCVSELVAFSPCLPYVSAPPNHIATTVPPECCDAFSSALSSGDGYCLCYLLRQPLLLGFPLNESMLASLPSLCFPKTNFSLESLCSAAPVFPPSATTGHESGQTQPSTSDGAPFDGSNPLMNKPPESVNASIFRFPPKSARSPPTPPGFPVKPATHSSATKWNHSGNSWFVFAIVIFLLK